MEADGRNARQGTFQALLLRAREQLCQVYNTHTVAQDFSIK
jgi:predicted aminopeptidase